MEIVYSPAAARQLFDPLQRVYLFAGEDDTQKDEALALLQGTCIDPAFSDFDLETLDAESAAADTILAAAALAPFASPRRLVIVRGAEIYRRREKQGESDRLALGIAAIPSLTCLAIRVAAGEDESGRGKTAVSAKLDAAVKEHGALVRCKPLAEDAAIHWLQSEARAAGKDLTTEAAERLMHSARGDRHGIRMELEKAICFVGERKRIGEDDVEAVCCANPEDVMFRLVDAIGQRNADRAFTLFREVMRYDSKAQSVAGRLIALLGRQLRLLWQAQELSRMGFEPGAVRSLPPEVLAELPSDGSIVSMAWKAGDLFRQARAWKREELAAAMDLLLRTDLANKGSGEGFEDPLANLEVLILRLCRAK